jgi:hypothetical protein
MVRELVPSGKGFAVIVGPQRATSYCLLMSTLGVDFDFSQVARRAMDLGATADQIPYIMATTLNMAAENTRSYLIETTWPSSVTVRNRSFMNAALTSKHSRATKGDLTVEIYHKIGRASHCMPREAPGAPRAATFRSRRRSTCSGRAAAPCGRSSSRRICGTASSVGASSSNARADRRARRRAASS